jgi:small subunit ribosomal protein S3Ae
VLSIYDMVSHVTIFSLQVRAIRKKMVELITSNVVSSDLKDVVNKLLPDSIAKDIEKACQGIYPLHDVYIRKVRV